MTRFFLRVGGFLGIVSPHENLPTAFAPALPARHARLRGQVHAEDRSTIEGKIVGEEGADYIISVKIGTIKDERRASKADVVKQFTEQKDETAFAELAKFVPTPDLQCSRDLRGPAGEGGSLHQGSQGLAAAQKSTRSTTPFRTNSPP